MSTRIETDAMGPMEVPADRYYGATTARAVENFAFSRLRFSRRFIWAHAAIKAEAAQVNRELGIVERHLADAITAAANEVAAGHHDEHLVVDLFQTGSGTSTNMNVNEVIANLATERLGGALGSKLVHPNDHVNAGQSSNDTIPTAMHVAAVAIFEEELLPGLETLQAALQEKAVAFDHIVKTGRTHLIDALPVRLGQEFRGYATQVRKSIARVRRVLPDLRELTLGSTVVGTGINAAEGFATRVIARLAQRTGFALRETDDHFESLGAKDAAAMASSTLQAVAVALFKIVDDIRWMASGPDGGIGEIRLKPLQPGSSIIPGLGKVNPVICEAVMQIVAHVMGNHAAVVWGAANGNFELNVMAPVIAHNLLESAELLARAATHLAEKTIAPMQADEERCREVVARNYTIVTALTPRIGYDKAAEVARLAREQRRPVREIAVELQVLPEDELDAVLDLARLTRGGRL